MTHTTGWKARRVALIGAGKASEFGTDRLRKVGDRGSARRADRAA